MGEEEEKRSAAAVKAVESDKASATTRESVVRKARRWRRWKRRLMALVIVVACVWGVFALFPYMLQYIDFPEINVDLSENLKDTPPGLFPDQTLVAKYSVAKAHGHYAIAVQGRILGWPFTANADVKLKFRFFGIDATGTADLKLDGSHYSVKANFTASVPGGWSADVEMPESPLSDSDPYLKSILSRHPEELVRKLILDGIISFTAHAEQEKIFRGIPKWQAKARIKQLDAVIDSDGKPVRIENFRVGVGAKGIAEHLDLDPMFVHIDSINGAGCVLTNAFASIRATETAFLVTEAGAGFCGGDLHLYALFLDPKKLNAGATIYLDGIDAGQALSHLRAFKGEATGTLNGKLPFRLANGNEIHFGSCYLHSVPGEIGKFKLYESTTVIDAMALGSISAETSDNLANALSDLDYSALKIGFMPEGDGNMALTIKLEGTAKRGEVSAPVSLDVTFHGQIEQLINTGLRAMTRKEQKKQ